MPLLATPWFDCQKDHVGWVKAQFYVLNFQLEIQLNCSFWSFSSLPINDQGEVSSSAPNELFAPYDCYCDTCWVVSSLRVDFQSALH